MALRAPVGGTFNLAPEGAHVARCIRVIDMGSTFSEKWNKDIRKVMITFELPLELIPDGELAGLPFAVSAFQTLSMNPKANLRKMLESWRGKTFTDKEAEEFDITTLLRAPAFVNIIHEETGGTTYANLKTIMPVPKGTQVPEPKSDVYAYSIEEHDEAAWSKMSDKIKAKIMATKEWKAREQGGGFDPNDDVPF